ncbi:hypothetical protein [Virgibacillus alimentarius]|uniref:Uncharacterized protein n=1 Tax=Virgibacillus alimentarius TaxID=698769 RepID=A0ABS4S4Y7_9BACI|nr:MULTISPECIES: hypothetical protein [Virgibacillus]MBP2256560.1 hypothetical protein [Virgibacillus alimentarius]HLR66506.1 hypothetical protein [Virgibacillus sp.]
MVRSFIVFLMLIVVFLAGMLFGIDRGQIASKPVETDTERIVNHEEEKMDEGEIIEKERILQIEEADETTTADVEPDNHLTQKTASVLEAGVKGFYEIIVQILYQISQLFI